MTATLERLLTPDLFRRDPLFTSRIMPYTDGEKVYVLTPSEVNAILERRGAVVDLHPGMGGVSPKKLRVDAFLLQLIICLLGVVILSVHGVLLVLVHLKKNLSHLRFLKN